MTSSRNELYKTELLYRINLEKLKQGCQKNWFGSTNTEFGLTPESIILNESEPIHFVQFLFYLKEYSYQDHKWMVFSRNGLISIMKKHQNIYLEDPKYWGKSFTKEFHSQVDFFIEMFCDVAGYY